MQNFLLQKRRFKKNFKSCKACIHDNYKKRIDFILIKQKAGKIFNYFKKIRAKARLNFFKRCWLQNINNKQNLHNIQLKEKIRGAKKFAKEPSVKLA